MPRSTARWDSARTLQALGLNHRTEHRDADRHASAPAWLRRGPPEGRAVALGAHSYRSVESILNHRLAGEQIELALPIERLLQLTGDIPWTHPTGMAKALAEQLGSPETAALSEDRAHRRPRTERHSRQLTNRLRRARDGACKDIDFRQPRGLDRDLVLSLDGRWVRDRTGPQKRRRSPPVMPGIDAMKVAGSSGREPARPARNRRFTRNSLCRNGPHRRPHRRCHSRPARHNGKENPCEKHVHR